MSASMLEERYLWARGQLYVVRRDGPVELEKYGPPLEDYVARWLTEGNSLCRQPERAGGLVVHSVDLPTYAPLRGEIPESPTTEQPDTEEQTDWVEFRLEDDTGAPIAGARYLLTLPDGSVRPGVTPANGVIYWKDIPAGECELSFPDLHESEWNSR
jgi:hypothetical protein